MTKVRFHPQVRSGDYAYEIDHEEEWDTEWDVGEVPDNLRDDTYESDNLRFHPNAPEWVKKWSGPFYVEILREEIR